MKEKNNGALLILNDKKSNPEVFVIGHALGEMNFLSNYKSKNNCNTINRFREERGNKF